MFVIINSDISSWTKWHPLQTVPVINRLIYVLSIDLGIEFGFEPFGFPSFVMGSVKCVLYDGPREGLSRSEYSAAHWRSSLKVSLSHMTVHCILIMNL